MQKQKKESRGKWIDTTKGQRTFAKRNALPDPRQQHQLPVVEVDDYSEEEALIDSMFAPTDEEREWIYQYHRQDSEYDGLDTFIDLS